MYRFERASIAAVALAALSAGPTTAQAPTPDNSFYDITDLGYILFANEYIKAINCQYDTEIPLAEITQVFANNGCFFGSADVGGVIPTGKPSLGSGQAIASKNGYFVSGGPGVSIPLAPIRPGTPFALRFGADVFYSHVTPDQIVNLGGGSPLQLSNSSKDQSFGMIFYGGVALAGPRRWQFTFDAGLGPARRTVELNGLVNPLASGGNTVLAGRIRGGIDFAVTRNITLGGFVGYQWIGGTSVRVNATGAQLDVGELRSLIAGMRAKVTFVDLQSEQFPGGAIRGQVRFNPEP